MIFVGRFCKKVILKHSNDEIDLITKQKWRGNQKIPKYYVPSNEKKKHWSHGQAKWWRKVQQLGGKTAIEILSHSVPVL